MPFFIKGRAGVNGSDFSTIAPPITTTSQALNSARSSLFTYSSPQAADEKSAKEKTAEKRADNKPGLFNFYLF